MCFFFYIKSINQLCTITRLNRTAWLCLYTDRSNLCGIVTPVARCQNEVSHIQVQKNNSARIPVFNSLQSDEWWFGTEWEWEVELQAEIWSVSFCTHACMGVWRSRGWGERRRADEKHDRKEENRGERGENRTEEKVDEDVRKHVMKKSLEQKKVLRRQEEIRYKEWIEEKNKTKKKKSN